MKQLKVTFCPGCEKTMGLGTEISGLHAKSDEPTYIFEEDIINSGKAP